MKIVTVIGARPQFVKAAVVSRALTDSGSGARETIVHTGQHFDTNMSAVFFDELGIPAPAYNLGIGGGSHGQNTGRMIEAIERVLTEQKPDWALVYGDTDSTLAGALAAVKLHIPVAHVEAGLRSFNRRMPEEINRVLTDHASDLLFAPTDVAVKNLASEGITRGIQKVGDVMLDAVNHYSALAPAPEETLERFGVHAGAYILATIHRPANTDASENLKSILEALAQAALPVLLPVHPRMRNRLEKDGVAIPPTVRVLDPVGYLDMAVLEKHARLIVTDSGGVQKEAFFHRVPCVTVRDETEWTELLEAGVNRLVRSDWELLAAWVSDDIPVFNESAPTGLYGDGNAGHRIVAALTGSD